MSAKKKTDTPKQKPDKKPILKEPDQEKKEIIIGYEASQSQLLGIYSNRAIIRHTSREFLLDFASSFDNISVLATRVIISPQHAKLLHTALGKNIENYEEKYGGIEVDDEQG